MESPEKSIIRERILKARDQLAPPERRQKSSRIAARVLSLPEFQQATTILFYYSFRSEVETENLIEQALQEGKTVALPLTLSMPEGMLAYKIGDLSGDLKTGRFGLQEPIKERTSPLLPQEIELIILPGVAFDLSGARLGWGAGYYDRFIRSLPQKVPLIALAFEVQLVEELPVDEHDIAMDKIVTEERVVDCKRAS